MEFSRILMILVNFICKFLKFVKMIILNSQFKFYNIYNMDGLLIQKGEFESNLNVSNLPSGNYLIKVFNSKSNFKTLKFIKL
jgi:hypothetical protein